MAVMNAYDDDDELDDDPDAPDAFDRDENEDSVDTIPCPKCGKPIYENAEICHKCGSYVSREESAQHKPIWMIATVITLVVVLLFVWLSRAFG